MTFLRKYFDAENSSVTVLVSSAVVLSSLFNYSVLIVVTRIGNSVRVQAELSQMCENGACSLKGLPPDLLVFEICWPFLLSLPVIYLVYV